MAKFFLSIIERMNGLRSKAANPKVHRTLLFVAVGLFVGSTWLALRNLPVHNFDPDYAYLVLLFFLGFFNIALNGAEYHLIAAMRGFKVGVSESTTISVFSSAANILPIPGAALVKVSAISSKGDSFGGAVAVTALAGINWLACSLIFAGLFLLPTTYVGVAIAFLVAGTILFFGSLALYHLKSGSNLKNFFWLTLSEIAVVFLGAFRLFVVGKAIGFEISFAQAAVLSSAGTISAAIGIFPGSLGISQVLAGILGAGVGLTASVGVVASAVDRVAATVTLAVVALPLAFVRRRRGETVPVDDLADVR